MADSPGLEDLPVPEELGPDAGVAVRSNLDRLQRAVDANDVAAVIGAVKDLTECVCKVVLDGLGGTYGSAVRMSKLVNQTLEVLGLHPAGLPDRPALRQLSQSLIGTVHAIAELRSTDGTGHGRSRETDLDAEHAILVRVNALAWCRWTLVAAGRIARERAALMEQVAMIGTEVFHRGQLLQLVEQLRVPELGAPLQHSVGLAIARRYAVGGTFVAHMDIIEPLSRGELAYPAPFAAGVVEGLMLDYYGYLRATARHVNDIRGIASRLPDPDARAVLEALADRVADAGMSYAFTTEAKEATAEALDEWAEQEADAAVRAAVQRIAERLRSL